MRTPEEIAALRKQLEELIDLGRSVEGEEPGNGDPDPVLLSLFAMVQVLDWQEGKDLELIQIIQDTARKHRVARRARRN